MEKGRKRTETDAGQARGDSASRLNQNPDLWALRLPIRAATQRSQSQRSLGFAGSRIAEAGSRLKQRWPFSRPSPRELDNQHK